MEYLEILKKDLIRDEGMRLKPYRCTAGKLTIGVGRNLDDVGISEKEALDMLQTDIVRVYDALTKSLAFFPNLSQNQQRALVNMGFNLGVSKLLKFKKMLAELSRGNGEAAAKEALDSKWAGQVGDRATRVAELLRN